MSDKIYVESKKKPGIGKILLYVLGGLLLGLLGSMGGKKDENKSANNTSTNSTTSVVSTKSVASTAPEKTEYAVGESINTHNISIKVNSITDYIETNKNLQPTKGNKIIRVNVTYTNKYTDREITFSSADFKYQTKDGVIKQIIYTSEKDIGSGQLAPDGTITGDIFIEVPDEQNGSKLIFDSVTTTDKRIYINLQDSLK